MKKPIYKTAPYLQKVMTRYPIDSDIKSIAVADDDLLYVASSKGLHKLENGVWSTILESENITCVYSDKEGRVYAAVGKTLYSVNEKSIKVKYEFENDITAVGGETRLYVLTGRYLFGEYDGKMEFENDTDFESFCVSERNGKVSIANNKIVQRMEGKRKTWRCIFPDYSPMPEMNIQTIAFDKIGYLWVGAKEGLYIYDYKEGWYSRKQIGILPEESINAITFLENGDAFLGTDAGAVLISKGSAKYLPATRYAFSPDVTAVAERNGVLYTGSQGGIIKIEHKEMTLEEKAWEQFRFTEKYFPRKQGYVTGIGGIVNGDMSNATRSNVTDNDGLWTHTYLASLCFCYAVTKDEEVLKAAKRTKDAGLFLTRAPEIKGFTARAVRFSDEPKWGVGLGENKRDEEWHRSSDGTYEWLGETSSDEMTGHYMGFSLYYDLVADDEEKEEIREAVCNITDHILEHDGYLCDYDNLPTTWACWNEHELNHNSKWMWEKGVNSLEMLGFLKIAHHMSGDEKYLKKYNELIHEHHFLLNAAYHKREDGHACHIDDYLGMCNIFPYLMLEDDPAIRSYLLMGLKHHFEYERIEGNPFYNFIYGAFTGDVCDLDYNVKVLQEYPLSLIRYKMINSTRRNVVMTDEGVKWGGGIQPLKPFNWDERNFSELGSRPYTVDGGDESRAIPGSSYMLIYWFARYMGLIE